MSKFDASTAAEPLDYDLRPYSDEQGTVPEPSDTQVAAFYAGLGKTMEAALGDERMAGVDITDAEQVGVLFLTLTADDHAAMYEATLRLHADVCGGRPSYDSLSQLPYRLRLAFYGMVQGWLRPESSRPATND